MSQHREGRPDGEKPDPNYLVTPTNTLSFCPSKLRTIVLLFTTWDKKKNHTKNKNLNYNS